jgi:hypothetical protein
MKTNRYREQHSEIHVPENVDLFLNAVMVESALYHVELQESDRDKSISRFLRIYTFLTFREYEIVFYGVSSVCLYVYRLRVYEYVQMCPHYRLNK